ncbi:GreA/GreB family elongation factor [Albidovulum sediminicola]|uniref:GreA/GreB family elongation factor n=1 Tax=Albidovulum sediminicola TaxID=2984331 RepID=A0ABT2Z5K5_9RHOB|nr:GreA/GreB family elongation factor [Defluviimonas sp. WL0075]MCV2866429.1 GreA/GreB family elongation factor [Defluviimonas sp. WL0075]
MSRAFVKEDGPDNEPLPDLPISPHPNYVTPRGLAALRDRLAALQAELSRLRARAERLDRLPERAVERDIRYVEARLRSAIPVDPNDAPPGEAAFGTRITVADEDGTEQAFEIVGEDEADAALGRIAPQSPLARALIGARVGDTVDWKRPAGTVTLELLAIEPLRC